MPFLGSQTPRHLSGAVSVGESAQWAWGLSSPRDWETNWKEKTWYIKDIEGIRGGGKTMSFAYVRVEKSTYKNVMANTAHALRAPGTPGLSHVDLSRSSLNMVWSCQENEGADHRNITAALKEYKAKTGAKEYKDAPPCLHMLVGVSVDWIQETGDLHDPENPRNIALFKAAKDWSEKTFGAGSTIALRMDMDEKGGAVVDVIASPVFTVKQRKTEKKMISVNKALEAAFGKTYQYKKAQDSWAEYAQTHLDKDLRRGEDKEKTGREHLHHTAYKEVMEQKERLQTENKFLIKENETLRKNRESALENLSDLNLQIGVAEEELSHTRAEYETERAHVEALKQDKSVLEIRLKELEKTEQERLDAINHANDTMTALRKKIRAAQSKLEAFSGSIFGIFARARVVDVEKKAKVKIDKATAAFEEQRRGLLEDINTKTFQLNNASQRAETAEGKLRSVERERDEKAALLETLIKNVPGAWEYINGRNRAGRGLPGLTM